MRRTRSIRSRASSRSALVSIRSNTPQASARQMMTTSRGPGMSSPNSTPMMRRRTSRSAFPSTVGYRRARATLDESSMAPSSADLRMPASTRRASAVERIRSPSSAMPRTQYSAPCVCPLAATRARTGSRRSSPTGAGSTTTRRSRSVSIRFSSARSMSAAPARIWRRFDSGTEARSPASSFRSSSRSSSANRSTARPSGPDRRGRVHSPAPGGS